MKFYCLGGFREVGRNAILLETSKENVLLDYGIKVETNELPLSINKKIDALILCHPHLDHCGAIPTLYKKKLYKFPLYSTAASLDQSHLLWKDSMKVAKLKGKKQVFNDSDIQRTKQNENRITFGQRFEIGNLNIEVHFAGHVPGSFMPVIEYKDKRILYTSDFNTLDTRLLKGANIKEFKDIDILITESTYADREHPKREEVEKEFIKSVEETIENGGVALIPVFAVGRAAEIMLVLNSSNPDYPIYLDGMAREATEIALRYPELLKDPEALRNAMDKIIPLYTDDERKEAIKSPCAIITTGGCLEGGPIIFYLSQLHDIENSSLLFTGYQIPNTAGRKVLETGRFITNELNFKIKMKIKSFDFSAHIGRTQLLNFIKTLNPEKVICMHGDNCEKFANEISETFGVYAEAPENGDVIKI
ncbi:MAG: MBL fold metallo-hydrolase RNA specificity domain-containing protein [Candidatus Aenigmatarchaeota archaeon]